MANENNNLLLITELQCIGCISYWTNLVKFHNQCFEQFEHFQKIGYRNRYQILSASGPLTLSVPIVGGRASRLPIKEVTIDNSAKWQIHHWRGIESCYNKSPFFFYYQPYLEAFYFRHYKWLWDFNIDLFNWLLKSLKLKVEISYTETFVRQYEQTSVIDARNVFKPANRLSFEHEPYLQVFGETFEQNLSLFDLLFNLGSQSENYLLNQSNY